MNNRIPLLILLSVVIAVSGFGFSVCFASSGYSFGGTEGKNGSCLQCHGDAGRVSGKRFVDPVRYGTTIHARIGCPSCHDSVKDGHQGTGKVSTKSDCRGCHADIRAEYDTSVHSLKAPCGGCHNPHEARTTVEISGQEVNRMCASCHDTYRMMAIHGDWLPRAELHIEMLPCVTCHTGSRDYVITMYLTKQKRGAGPGTELAGFEELNRIAGGKGIISLIDANSDGYVSLAELRLFNRSNDRGDLRLKGMMTPEKVTHTFQILDNRRDCTFCHASGPGAMQTSWLAIPQEDGSLQRVAVEKGAVLDALYATPDFYMTGATRNETLNKIGGAIIAGGLVMPVGHGFFRFLTRKNRREKETRHE